ncbi:MAG TPA: metalloregulator ArsR/SmtB family transcription factor [Acetobacteraceae bacterium]|nr:metalloregulator ArsR/SmtB family transcription factor [Acetobacteraceae bacterium]
MTGLFPVMYITYQLWNWTAMQASERLNLTFAALADPTRRAILARLATGEATVTELAEPFEMSQPAISKHLKVLERAGLISMDVDAQRRPRKLEPKRLQEAVDWIERYREIFEQSYQRLDALIEQLQAKPSGRKRARK